MHQQLIDHVDLWLDNAARFVCTYMPVDIDTDTAYEEMLRCSAINTEAMVAAFREAVKYLEPQSTHKRISFTLADGRTAYLHAKFFPTKKWPAFLRPPQNLAINPESKFAALLDTPICVATEWVHLMYVWKQLRIPMYNLTNEQLGHLMPWLRECLADFDPYNLPAGRKIANADHKLLIKEYAAIMAYDNDVLFFPRLSKELTAIARSGKILISQYRMLSAVYPGEHGETPISVDISETLVEPWVKEFLAEALRDWADDQAMRKSRQLEAIMRRAAKLEKYNREK